MNSQWIRWDGVPVYGYPIPHGIRNPEGEGWIQGPVTEASKWASEREDVMKRFTEELWKATGDGSVKRQSGAKPPWHIDKSHEAAIYSHLCKWKRGELRDDASGAHPLVHAAWRCLAIACKETGNVPQDYINGFQQLDLFGD